MSTREHVLVIVFSGLIGLVIGSFLSVVTSRVPRGESIVRPDSHCPQCHARLRSRDNIPLVSYVALKGRCRSCGVRIPWRYPALEAVTGIGFAAVAWRLPSLWVIPPYCVLFACLIASAMIDLESMKIPSVVVYWSGAIGLPLLVVASLGTHRPEALLYSVASAAAVGALFGAIFLGSSGMGFGDVRLLTLAAFFTGWLDSRGFGFGVTAVALLLTIFIAGAIAIVALVRGTGTGKTRLPFAPPIAGGVMLAALFGPTMLHWWLG